MPTEQIDRRYSIVLSKSGYSTYVESLTFLFLLRRRGLIWKSYVSPRGDFLLFHFRSTPSEPPLLKEFFSPSGQIGLF